eukprot:TRINITY_DN3923_c0_g2_i1.p2 TRINITY_DN3923_c0_g2~~TRINITY_DN3923_c0_g2_i1.p2  ORF type:complete len:238 (+),score=81.88 TRINITY_DN3923_c0_g2_i1:1334-2047(+)
MNQKLIDLAHEQEQLALELKEQLETELKTTEETYMEEKVANQQEISKLKATVLMDGKSSEEKKGQLQNHIQETNSEREKISEELKLFKDKLEKEKEDLDKQNKDLENRIKNFEREHKSLEEAMKRQQAEQGKSIFQLRKEMLRHISCMNEWKIFLDQQGMKYESEDLALHMESAPDYVMMSFAKRIETVSQALGEENSRLEVFTQRRESGEDDKEDKEKNELDKKAASTKIGARGKK